MTIRERLNNDIKVAMKSKDASLQTLRNINAVIKQYEVDNRGVEITDAIIISLLNKMVKQRQESIIAYQKGNRLDLVKIEQSEIDIINQYLPKSVSESVIKDVVIKIISDNNLTSNKQLGVLMKLSKEQFLNQNVDFSIVSKLGKELL